MKIEPTFHTLRSTTAVESLESRLMTAPGKPAGMRLDEPSPAGFEELYRRLSMMEGRGEKSHYVFLQSLRGEEGTTRLYPNAQALLTVTQQLLVRLKEDGLEQSQLYKEIKGANGLAFNMKLAVLNHMRDVFQPMDDDARESNQW